jgi:osmotically-inducible protein OsmY
VNQKVDSVLQRTLSRSLAGRDLPTPELVWNGREVTLRGQVPDDNSRSLVENIVRLQPGVDQVVNELTVLENAETIPPGEVR